jgi:phosphoribosylformylglycinamidine synthase
MVGLIEDISQRCDIGFVKEGDQVFLLGSGLDSEGLGGSDYLELVHNLAKGRPHIDLDLEKRVQSCCLKAIKRGVVNSAHDCANGGLAITLAESCLRRGLGFKGDRWQFSDRLDAALFGEAQSRIVISVDQDKVQQLQALATGQGVPLTRLGTVGGKRFIIDGYIDLPLEEMAAVWRQSLEKILS